jgi:hypothetical protein
MPTRIDKGHILGKKVQVVVPIEINRKDAVE